MLDTLKTLINFRSVSSDQNAVHTLLDYIEERLGSRGLTVQRIQHEGVYSLYASTRGQAHAHVMLQGHIDVVPGGEIFRQEGDKIYGRGCYDMLFAAASFLAFIDSLDTPADYDVSLLLTGDEELGGEHGVHEILDREGYTCDVCILPDAGEGLGTMSVSAKGIYHLKLQVNGTSHHGSRPWEGDGAGNKAIAFLTEASLLFDPSSRDNSTFVISQLQAGTSAINQAPAEANIGIDIRYKDADDFIRIKDGLDALRKKYDVEITFEETGRNFDLNTDNPLIQQFISLYGRRVGKPIEFIKAHGSSDARYFDDNGMPVIMFRPDGGNAHGDGEWLSYESWKTFHEILTDYVLQTARQ